MRTVQLSAILFELIFDFLYDFQEVQKGSEMRMFNALVELGIRTKGEI